MPVPGGTADASEDSPKPSYAEKRWQSDVIVDLIKQFGFPYIALNPGASYRGLHDSLVNYLGNLAPSMILCNHEEVAVGIAHGYAKYAGRAMAARASSLGSGTATTPTLGSIVQKG